MTTRKESSKEKSDERDDRPLKEKVLAGLKEAGIVLGLFILINNFVVASFLVPTGSMENEVMAGELLFVNKFIYGPTTPRTVPLTGIEFGFMQIPPVRLPWLRFPGISTVERGDVIVFEFPGYRDEVDAGEFQFYLKRCVGLPGDTIEIRDRVLYVNADMMPLPRNITFDRPWPVSESIPDDRIFPRGASWNEDWYGPLVIPYEGMVIPLHPDTLSAWEVFIRREGHTVARAGDDILIDGAVATSYTVERDYLFGMGDHRDNSLDSRFWGFIPEENLVGTPIVVYWSWNTDIPLYDIPGRIGSVRWGRIFSLIR